MHKDKRFSVFISSTFEDLKEERRAVQDIVIKAGDFPVQMEDFPAVDESQLEFIKSLIDACDFYFLIIGGRYGTPSDDGLSFTHKEYRYAVERCIPVLVFLHGDRDSISARNTESSPEGKKKLNSFIKEAETGRLRKIWTNFGELQNAVREALDHAKATKDAVGWVRGNTVASIDVLSELNDVRKENVKYREEIGHLEESIDLPPMPSPDEEIEINLLPMNKTVQYSGGFSGKTSGSFAKVRCSWLTAFPTFFDNFDWHSSDWGGEEIYSTDIEDTCSGIGSAMASESSKFDTTGLFKISRSTLQRLTSYYIEAGLMVEDGEHPFTECGKRLARRLRISTGGKDTFTIVEGSVDVTSSEADNSGLDDEIPF